MTTDGDGMVAEHSLKLEIRSYGIISVKEEKIEYIGTSSDASFVLFDASGPTDERSSMPSMAGPPPIRKSGLDAKGRDATVVSDRTEPRRSKH